MDELTEGRLREDLRRCATFADPPRPPVDLLERLGEQQARGRRARWAVAAVTTAVAASVVVAMVLVPLAGNDDSAPTPSGPASSTPPTSGATEPPTGPPPSIPYVHNGRLHFDGSVLDVRADSIAYAGDTALLSRFDPREGNRISIVRGDLTVLDLGTGFEASLSPGGDYAWWFNEDTRGTTVTVWDTAAGRQLGTHLIDGSMSGPTGGGGDLDIIGVDDSGRLFWALLTGPQTREYAMWQAPAGPLTRVRLEEAWPVTLTTAGLQIVGSFISSSFEGDTGPPYIAAQVGDDGVLTSCPSDAGCAAFRSPQQALHSPSAGYAVFREEAAEGTGSRIRVVAREHEGPRYAFLDPVLPDGTWHTGLRVIGWEDDTSLLLLDTHDLTDRSVLRCDVPAMTCESALEIGDGHGWVLPEQGIVS